WVGTGNASIERWYARMLDRQPRLETRGVFAPWDLVDRYHRRGIIKGYILFRLDRSSGDINAHRAGMDCSVNVATSLAGILDGILIDESLEPEAKKRGLSLLIDARDKTQQWCFETHKARFNRRLLCAQDPRKENLRDLAIAQQVFTLYGDDEP